MVISTTCAVSVILVIIFVPNVVPLLLPRHQHQHQNLLQLLRLLQLQNQQFLMIFFQFVPKVMQCRSALLLLLKGEAVHVIVVIKVLLEVPMATLCSVAELVSVPMIIVTSVVFFVRLHLLQPQQLL